MYVFTGSGAGVGVGLHGNAVQTSFQAGLVAFPVWAQSEQILEIAAITAVSEALFHEIAFAAEVSLSCHISALASLAGNTARCWTMGHTISRSGLRVG